MPTVSDFDSQRQHYAYFKQLTTRWIDNDVYGHVNNAVYYTWFDTVTNSFLIEQGGLDIQRSDVIGFIVASSCEYHTPVKFPNNIDAGLRVNRIGNSSVEYGVAIFTEGDDKAAANGTFTHVYVNRASGQSTKIPEVMRSALKSLLSPGDIQR